MHTLEEVRAEYSRLDRLIGIDTSSIELKVSNRAVRQLGSFRVPARPGAGPLRITLSGLVMEDDLLFLDTVRHEYAHAAVHLLHPGEKHGHDKVWKDMCRLIGCRPRSRSAYSDSAAKLSQERARYIVRCTGCGRESGYVRRGRTVELLLKGQGRRLRCTACGSSGFELYVRAEK